MLFTSSNITPIILQVLQLTANNLQVISNIRRKPLTDFTMFNRNNMNLPIMNEEQTILSSRAPHKKTIHHQYNRGYKLGSGDYNY